MSNEAAATIELADLLVFKADFHLMRGELLVYAARVLAHNILGLCQFGE